MLGHTGPCRAGVLALVAVCAAGGCETPKPVVTPAQLEDAPLTISVSTVGVFANGRPWDLSVNSAGQAELTIGTSPLPVSAARDPIRKQFQVSKEQMAEFRKALADEKFFELAGEYGERVPDGSEQVVTVAAGRHANTVRVHFLGNWLAAKDKAKLREPARAVRLLVLVRGWFDEAEAVDHREWDRRVLDVAK
jgi:hypothetical protein